MSLIGAIPRAILPEELNEDDKSEIAEDPSRHGDPNEVGIRVDRSYLDHSKAEGTRMDRTLVMIMVSHSSPAPTTGVALVQFVKLVLSATRKQSGRPRGISAQPA